MRITIFVENYYKGGLDTFLANLIRGWPNSEDTFLLHCNSNHPGLVNLRESFSDRVSIIEYSNFLTRVNTSQLNIKGAYASRLINRILGMIFRVIEFPILFPYFVIRFKSFSNSSTADRLLVVNGGYPGGLLARSALVGWKLAKRKPLGVLNIHILSVPRRFPRSILERQVDSLIHSSTSSIVVVSNACKESFSNRFNSDQLKNFEVICNGITPVEENSFERVPISSDAPSRVPYLVMLGTFEPRKGHAFLLSAYKSLLALGCSIELRIYGEGTKAQRDEILLQIRNLDLDGKVFLGNFSNKPREIIQNVEVLLIPSQSYESFGLTAIEAMAVGTPVVSTGVGGLPEVLKNGGGIICEQENPLIFADAINRILHDPSLRESIGLSGQSSFKQHFTAEIMSSKYHSLMENLC